MKTTQHTPGPWHVESGHSASGKAILIVHEDQNDPRHRCVIAEVALFNQTEANAQFIVTACNAHYELLEALKLAEATIERVAKRHGPFSSADGTLGVIRGAIARAAIQSAQEKE